MIQIRAFQADDEAHLTRFLALAAHEDDARIVLANPDLARYVEAWGRDGDTAVVAHDGDEIVGIAWARLWTLNDHGFGWIDERTPEMAIAVAPNYRGRGVGARLIEALELALRGKGATQVALNVRADSSAVRLYQRVGFERISSSERINRTGGRSFSMLALLG